MVAVDISLRTAKPSDRDFLWWLHRVTMKEYVDKTWGWDEQWQKERFDETFEPETLQLIESDNRAVGYIKVERSPNEIFLSAIEVAPDFQNRGIATKLLSELILESRANKVPIRLQVLKVNPARRFYERLGFQQIQETETHSIMLRDPL